MKHMRILLGLALLYPHISLYAQLSTQEQPVTFDSRLKMTVISKSSASRVMTPALDIAKIKAEDEKEGKEVPPRFGYPHKVNYNTNNSGTWYELPNGDKIWQLNVLCPNAKSINLLYDKFWIPEGGKFFLYTIDRKQHIGAFTSKNNKGDKNNVSGFATGLLYGDESILEYYQPKEVTEEAIISIDRIIHGYKSLRDDEGGYGQSASCEVNINCSDGQDWQNEKKAVALILVDGCRYASGALINTTDMNGEPYFLTADHCLIEGKYATGDSILNTYSFWWNYETEGCGNTLTEPNHYTTTGATIVSNSDCPDFALLRLTEDPKNIPGYTPFYLGWDCSGNTGTSGVCIHHPNGDVKKISTFAGQPITTSHNLCNDFWGVQWSAGHGITEKGSSGSPLLNSDHRLIGQQQGGNSSCLNPYGRDSYGKFCVAWSNYDDDIYFRLDHWLDPTNTGIQLLDGLLLISESKTMSTSECLFSNIRVTSSGLLTIQNDIELIGNGKVIVDAGGQLIINGGKLSNADVVLKPGATLVITNGGILECQTDFNAPLGVTVDVINGQIRH